MENARLLISMLFFITFCVYVLFGVYVLGMNRRLLLNRLFFALCFSLCLWSLGLTFAVNAGNAATCLVWWRFSSLGWCTFCSILLHLMLVFTDIRPVHRKLLLFISYAPAAVFVFAFCIFPETVKSLYSFENTPFGWVNAAEGSFWQVSYTIYSSALMLCCAAVLYNWMKTMESGKNKKYARILFYSVASGFFLTCLGLNNTLAAPALVIIPVAAMLMCIRQRGLLKNSSLQNMNQIMNSSNRARIYGFVTVSLFAGALLNIASMYILYGREPKSVLSFSLILFAAGILVKVVQNLRISDSVKDYLVLFVVLCMIPLITFKFIEFASITVWAFPFLFIIIFTVFNNRIMLIAMSAIILATQLAVWFFAPAATVQIDSSDHLARVGMYTVAAWLAYYVNKIYMSRLKENSDQASLQKSVAAISTDFIDINQSNISKKISRMLESVGTIFDADKSYIFLYDRKKNTASCKYLWSSDGASELKSLDSLPFFMYPWWGAQMKENGLISISDASQLPAEADMEKCLLANQGIQSLISVPLNDEKQSRGFIGILSSENPRKWTVEHASMLKIMSNLVVEAFSKIESEGKQQYLAFYDQLTSLANRTLFNDRLSQAINMANISGNIFGVLFLDLDSFKMVNDTMGHENGDELLKMVSGNLSKVIRNTDTVARFGGDEFLVLINNVADRGDIITVADKVLSVFKKPFIIEGKEFFVTASAGIAVYPMDGANVHTLIKNADIAMYHAKDSGKNQYKMCTSEMNTDIKNEVELTNYLHRALERNELHLFYQPQVDVSSGKILGVEALLRWTHPKFGNIAPAIFIPLAEKSGLINPIGEWVLSTACKQNKTWQDMGYRNIRMGVNLSFVQFRNAKLIDQIAAILRETGLSSEYLTLEITESAAIRNLEQIIDSMNRLKELGIRLSIDDFGTEYSSLSRIKELPIDHLKMDKQFVHGIDGSMKDQALTDSIINLAKNLGLRLVAEGVETTSQLQFLIHKGCDEIQGYYFYRPMPPNEIESLLGNELSE